jgi:hypothetical protein
MAYTVTQRGRSLQGAEVSVRRLNGVRSARDRPEHRISVENARVPA